MDDVGLEGVEKGDHQDFHGHVAGKRQQMAHPPAAAVRAALAPAYLVIVKDEGPGLGDVKPGRGFTPPMIRRCMRNPFESSRALSVESMILSPSWIQATGAKVVSATRSVTIGPWPNQKARITASATTPKAPTCQPGER
jgi:hypothetical protein